MTSISAVRDGLKARLATIPGLETFDTVPGSIPVPAAVVTPASGDFLTYDETMDGADGMLMTVTVFVSYADQRTAQENLDAYLADSGASSIRGAINGDRTLGGAAHYATVRGASNYGVVEYAGTQYLACDFAIEVRTL